MQFFQSLHSLGYSAVNLLLVWLVASAVLYRVLGLQRRNMIFRAVFAAVMLGILAYSANFLADQNRILNEAIRDEGGIKQNFPKN